MTLFLKKLLLILATAGITFSISCAQAATLPDAAINEPLVKGPQQVIVLAGGCFWGIQAVFQHVKGVEKAVSGYAGGMSDTAHYDIVSGGQTGHAESVQITYDPAKVTLGTLLKVFFSVAHDPTQLNHQGPDTGTQYRSEIFFMTPEQQKIATAYIEQLQKAAVFKSPIVTKVESLSGFYKAEDYHQDYATLHPDNPYIVLNDLPKVANLKKTLPEIYVEK